MKEERVFGKARQEVKVVRAGGAEESHVVIMELVETDEGSVGVVVDGEEKRAVPSYDFSHIPDPRPGDTIKFPDGAVITLRTKEGA